MKISNKKLLIIASTVCIMVFTLTIILINASNTKHTNFSDKKQLTNKDLIDKKAKTTKKQFVLKDPPDHLPILLYHNVCSDVPKGAENTSVTEEKFANQLISLREHGYTPILFSELHDYNNKKNNLPDKPVILTFDDGYKSNYTKTLPIIKKYNTKTNFFILHTLVGYKEGNLEYATWDELKEIKDSGIAEIYSHGADHIDYTKVSEEKLIKDLAENEKKLAENLGKSKIRVFAYPFGYFNEQTTSTLKDELKYDFQLTTRWRVDKFAKADMNSLSRINVDNFMSGEKLINVIEEEKQH